MNVIGIDVSKDTLDCYLDKKSNAGHHFKVSNDIDGFIQIYQFIKKSRIKKIVIVMEATGVYYQKLAEYFADIYAVYVVNPLKIHEYSKSHFVRTKTDKNDARLIADYGKRHLDKLIVYESKNDEQIHLEQLTALYRQLKLQITQNKNRLNIASNEYIKIVLSDLIKILESRAEETLNRIDALLLRSLYKDQYKNLQTIVGIGKCTASILLHHLLSKNFANVSKFIAFAGLNPQIKQSGTSVNGKETTTQYGHRKLKNALYMPALSAYNSPVFADFVNRLLKKGKPKMLVINALMRKLAKIAYCVFKSNKPFNRQQYLESSLT